MVIEENFYNAVIDMFENKATAENSNGLNIKKLSKQFPEMTFEDIAKQYKTIKRMWCKGLSYGVNS